MSSYSFFNLELSFPIKAQAFGTLKCTKRLTALQPGSIQPQVRLGGQVRTSQVRIGQVRTSQVRTGQVMTGEFRTGLLRIGLGEKNNLEQFKSN